ncbi:MAG TPA: heme-binding protein [Thermoanaerobaculia bacterium]|nr:heme-binding protein [Thermoanaerobaculia bacterium]
MAIEEPPYEVERTYAEFEVRRYPSYLVAETEAAGSLGEAGNAAFRRLLRYISGANRGEEEIAMTAPVAQAAAPEEGTRIAMTAPVAQTATGAGSGRWLVQFAMPREYTLETLPAPLDPEVRLRALPARRVAVLRYSGTWSAARYEEHLGILRRALAREGLAAAGEPVWARYDPPFQPWFLRRNEIQIELAG